MTHRINLTIVVKVVDLDTSHIYSCNHMVGMDKISFSVLSGGCKCVEDMGLGWGVWSKATVGLMGREREERSYLYNIKGV